jgi:hypothetical protein
MRWASASQQSAYFSRVRRESYTLEADVTLSAPFRRDSFDCSYIDDKLVLTCARRHPRTTRIIKGPLMLKATIPTRTRASEGEFRIFYRRGRQAREEIDLSIRRP